MSQAPLEIVRGSRRRRRFSSPATGRPQGVALIIVGVTNPTQPELMVLCQPDQANLVLEVSLGQPCEFFWEGALDCDSAPEEK